MHPSDRKCLILIIVPREKHPHSEIQRAHSGQSSPSLSVALGLMANCKQKYLHGGEGFGWER